jgi:hypothetical protein
VRDDPVRLVVIGARILQDDGLRSGLAGQDEEELQFGQVEIPILAPARAFMREAFIGEHLETNRRNGSLDRRSDRVDVALR